MKHLIVLLLPFAMSAQLPLTDEQVKFNYEKIELGRTFRSRLYECQTEFDLLIKDVSDLNDSIKKRNAENKVLREDNRGLIDEGNKLSYESGYLNAELKEAKKIWKNWITWLVAAGSFWLGSKIK